MSPIFARTLFVSASCALTLAMVNASAPAAASVVPSEFHQATVQFSDLNLASRAGQKTLSQRLNAAAEQVCLDDNGIVALRCRSAAVAQARTAIAQQHAVPAAADAAL